MPKQRKGATQDSPAQLLEAAFRHLQSSPRFKFVERIPVTQFLPPSKSGTHPLASMNVGDVIEKGAENIIDRRGVNNSVIKALLRMCEDLSHGATPDPAPVIFTDLSQARGKRVAKNESLFGSVEAEVRLTEAARRIKEYADTEFIRRAKLGDYWEKSWPRAPFEETFTFKQFAEFKMDVLLKKRSLTADKIEAMIRSIERGFEEHEKQSYARVPPQGMPRGVRPPQELHWKPSKRELPSIGRLLLSVYEQEGRFVTSSFTPLARLLPLIPDILLPHAFLIEWFLLDHSPAVVSEIFTMPHSELAALHKESRLAFRKLLKDTCPEIANYWDGALQEKRALTSLIDPYLDPRLNREFQIAVLRMFLESRQ